MKNWGITRKLFLVTALFFVCFYGIVIFSQLFFFERFYENHKLGKVEQNLARLAEYYKDTPGDNKRFSNQMLQFMNRNKSQVTVVDMKGNLVWEDPYHMIITEDDGQKTNVSLSLFMNLYGEEFKRLDIKVGDRLTVWSDEDIEAMESANPDHVMYPGQISKKGLPLIGEQGDSSKTVTGTVTELTLPKVWNNRHGLLMEAIYEQFPLPDTLIEDLRSMKSVEQEWEEPWSGIRNIITIQPVQRPDQELVLLFSLTSLQEVSDTNEAFQWFSIYWGIGGGVLILFLSLFFSKVVTRPLITLNQMAKRMVKLDFSMEPPPLPQRDEMGSLAQSMYTMSVNLDAALHEVTKANEKLQRDMEQKQKLEKMQQSFFSGASHELKTPLSIIKSFAEGLHDAVSVQKQDHYVSVIIEETEKMEKLIKDMLDLARFDSGSIALRKTTFLLSELTERVAGKLIHALDGKRSAIDVVPVNELPIVADPDWIEQVIRNLLVNAVRHADEHSIITVEIRSSALSTRLTVENKGQPIPQSQLDLIWERFHRIDASRSGYNSGNGLGLSIVKQILDMHGSAYGVTNLADGVRFFVEFPTGEGEES
ncbi:sensor histidine kinase [Paenibacillus hubeiensis]|uniref:sensor histidine kinase n=1 Tax=Paenibacillus hubeiensis TaxID=3077330 RepID=UPI0031BAB1D2